VDDGQATSYTASAEITVTVLPEARQRFRRGDANASGKVDISDPIATLGFLFLGDPASSTAATPRTRTTRVTST